MIERISRTSLLRARRLSVLADPERLAVRLILALGFLCLTAGNGWAQAAPKPARAERFNNPASREFPVPVTPPVAATAPMADAELPAGLSLDWDQRTLTIVNAKRARMSLD